MAIPTDRVQIQKRESTAGGGDGADDSDFLYSPLDSSEDCVELHGLFFQNSTGAKDELVSIWRNGDYLTFYDVATGVETTLSGLSTHATLSGLGADDHTQYVLADGTRNITGPIAINTATAVTNSPLEIKGAAPANNIPTLYLDNCSAGNGGINIKNGSGVVQLFGTSGASWNTYSPNRTMRFSVSNNAYDAAPQAFLFYQGTTTPARHIMAIEAASDVTTGNNLVLRNNYVGTGEHVGASLTNDTAATVGAQKHSPMLVFEGQGWKTSATAASQEVLMSMQLVPIQGAASPTSDLIFKSSINGTAYTDTAHITSTGIIKAGHAGTSVIPCLTSTTYPNTGISTASNVLYGIHSGASAWQATAGASGIFRVAGAGTVTSPGIARISDTGTGAWWPAASTYAHSTGGLEAVRWDATQNQINAGNLYMSNADGPALLNLGLSSDTPSILPDKSNTGLGVSSDGSRFGIVTGNLRRLYVNDTSVVIRNSGTAASVALGFANGIANGFFYPATSTLAVSTGGTEAVRFTSTNALFAGTVQTTGVIIGGNTGSDILVAADTLSTSDLALTTAGYVDARYASLGDLVTDHGALTGLTDDDHTQYLLATGARASSGVQTFSAGLSVGGNTASDILISTDLISTSNLALTTAGYVDARYASLSDLVTDHGGLTGLADDDHTQYLLATGARAVSGAMTFSAGLTIGGNTVSDILISSDTLSTSNLAIATAGYVDARYASLGDLVTDHGALTGLADDDHTQYLLATGARAVSGAMTFSSGLIIGGNTASDILISSDIVSSSNLAVATAGYVNAHYALSSSVVTDHGALTGLADDDHTQYLRTDGTRNGTGGQSFAGEVAVGGLINTGDESHGDRVMILSVGTALNMTNTGGHIVEEITGGFDWYGRFKTTAIGNIAATPIPLKIGDRLKSVRFRYYSSTTGTVRFSVVRIIPSTHSHSVQSTTTSNSTGSLDVTLSITLTQLTNYVIWAQTRSGAANDRPYVVEVTYDRP